MAGRSKSRPYESGDSRADGKYGDALMRRPYIALTSLLVGGEGCVQGCGLAVGVG